MTTYEPSITYLREICEGHEETYQRFGSDFTLRNYLRALHELCAARTGQRP